jgi:hypothetical protein
MQGKHLCVAHGGISVHELHETSVRYSQYAEAGFAPIPAAKTGLAPSLPYRSTLSDLLNLPDEACPQTNGRNVIL